MRQVVLPDWLGSAPEEARFLRLVLDHVSDCLVAVDTNGAIILINQPYCQLLGGEEADFLGRHITEVVGDQTRLHLVARGEGTRVGYPLEVRGHQLITKQVPVIQDGRIVGAVGMALFSDVDALKKTYGRLAQAGLAIQQQNRVWRSRLSLDDIIGEGRMMEAYRDALRLAGRHDLPVLIEGETGTGKELAAQAIHALSERSGGPFVWINCASIPSELIEAELFGYEGGAFTGARTRGKLGKVEVAAGGTLFLDEIGDMPQHLQGSLLRVLQTGEFVRVGGTSPIAANVRVICATHRPLASILDNGRFRRDLFYRLDVLTIRVPSLRQREDKRFLIERLRTRMARRMQCAPRKLSEPDMARMLAHSWPGNVRELESVLIRFLLTGSVTFAEVADDVAVPPPPKLMKAKLARTRLKEVREAVAAVDGDKERAARLLGISRAQLYRILKSGSADAAATD